MSLLAWLLALPVASVVHAAWHLLAARLLRIPYAASFGLGPPLWARGSFRLYAVPGARVAPRFDGIGAARVAAYLLTGPLGSLATGWAALAATFAIAAMAGTPDERSVVGYVVPGSLAEHAGIEAGDRVTAVDGAPIAWWSDLDPLLAEARPRAMVLTVVHDGTARPVRIDGPPESVGLRSSHLAAIVGVDDPASDAGRAGLHTGEKVISVDGVAVESWPELVRPLGDPGAHIVALEGRSVTLPEGPVTPLWGLVPADTFVGTVAEGSGAEAAGIQVGDHVLALDGQPVSSWAEIVQKVSAATDAPIVVTVRRAGVVLPLSVEPRVTYDTQVDGSIRKRHLLGIGSWEGAMRPAPSELRSRPLGEAIGEGATRANDWVAFTTSRVANLFVGAASPTETLGGPVTIYRIVDERPESWFVSLEGPLLFLATIVGALGAYNLLPLPYSDVFTGLDEAVWRRFRRRLPRRAYAVVGVLTLLGLFVFVLVMDILHAAG